MDEVWKDILGYEGFYRISNFRAESILYAKRVR